jgi:hypothetical protein
VFEGDFWGETVAEFSHSLGRFLPIAMQYGERLVRAPYQPLSSGFLISEIERLLSAGEADHRSLLFMRR